MAPRVKDTSAKPETTPKEESTGDWSALVKPSDGLKKVSVTRDGKPNPLKGFAQNAVGNPLALPVKNGAQAKDVTNWLRQDQLSTAGLEDAKVNIQYQDANGDVVRLKKTVVDGKTVTTYPDEIRAVHFVTKPGERVQRRYGKADIVKWFKENRGVDIVGSISKEQREEFKRENGFLVDKKAAAKTA